jgi:hypothetical protein
MRNLEHIKSVFVQLGRSLGTISREKEWPGFGSGLSKQEFEDWQTLINTLQHNNGWFTPENVRRALRGWSEMLSEKEFDKWLSAYQESIETTSGKTKKVGIVMAGNIPMVGFHDLLCVLVAGQKALVKLSSDDQLLIPAVIKLLTGLDESFEQQVAFLPRISGAHAYIATGSNNTARYFEHYFSAYPHIIRANRNSLAVVDENTTDEELAALGDDIFTYFGLGCRNVTRVLFPEGFDIDRFFKAIYPFHDIINHHKYANNYDYHKALFLLNREELLDNGFLLLRPEAAMHSPLGTLNYGFYQNKEEVIAEIERLNKEIQCVVSNSHWLKDTIKPGHSQSTQLWDYADGVDTMKFLLEQVK